MSLRRRLWLAVLLAVAGHELALAAGRVGSTQGGLQAADHAPVWNLAVGLVVAGAVAAVILAAWRILALRLKLTIAPALRLTDGRTLLRTATLVTVVALGLFLVQENIEHLTQHGHLPLLEPLLSGQYAEVLPVFAGLGLLLTAAGLLIGTTLRQLARAASSRTRRQPAPRRVGSWQGILHDHRRRTRMVTARSPYRGPPLPVIG